MKLKPKEIFDLLVETLKVNNAYIEKENVEEFNTVKKRMNGKYFKVEDHIKGLIYSLLSSQRKWKNIEEHIEEIDEIFYHYNSKKLKNTAPNEIVKKIKNIKCGNISIQNQMNTLKDNIITLERIHEKIENEFKGFKGTLEDQKEVEEIIEQLSNSNSKDKLKQMSEALVIQYLKYIGIRCMKPDTHILRICGTNRLGILQSIKDENIKDPKKLMKAQREFIMFSNKINEDPAFVSYLDSLFWRLGAEGYGEICKANPKCDLCKLREYCKYGRLNKMNNQELLKHYLNDIIKKGKKKDIINLILKLPINEMK